MEAGLGWSRSVMIGCATINLVGPLTVVANLAVYLRADGQSVGYGQRLMEIDGGGKPKGSGRTHLSARGRGAPLCCYNWNHSAQNPVDGVRIAFDRTWFS